MHDDTDEIDWKTEYADLTPNLQVEFRRTIGTKPEIAVISRYDTVRLVVLTYVGGGAITEWSVPRFVNPARTMAIRVEGMCRAGWSIVRVIRP